MDAPSGQAAPAPPPWRERLKRLKHLPWRRILPIAIPGAVLVLGLLAWLLVPGIVVRRRAAALGVVLDWDDLQIGDEVVKLRGARATLAGVDGVEIRADRVRVGRRGMDVTSVDAERVTVEVEGSATDRVLELADWSE